jgi:hypothetical protein
MLACGEPTRSKSQYRWLRSPSGLNSYFGYDHRSRTHPRAGARSIVLRLDDEAVPDRSK